MVKNKIGKEKEKVEMRAGLEIHQQLDTGKLFCRCPSILRNDEPDWIVRRKLHAVAGESGQVDLAAQHEATKDKEFIYQGYKDTCCLIEYDEQPPLEIDSEALKVVLEVACLLNCEILPVTQIMRKTVIDGSNTSGFQRTMLIARKGFIETSFGKVGVETVCLEEDAARIVSNDDKKTTYRLDRLGIPLIEIATAPEIYFPEQVKEAALKIGEILRACKVKRGIGTIRQDVNVSTPGHPRVEIKGFQEPRIMIKTVELEIKRQNKEVQDNSDKKTKIQGHVRKSNVDGTTSFLRPMPGADRMYPETDLPLLHISRDLINSVKNNLPKLRSDIKGELVQKGLEEEMIKLVLGENKLEEFESLLDVYNNSNFIAKVLLMLPKEIASHEKISVDKINELLNMDVLETVLGAVASKKISENDVKNVLEQIVKGKSIKQALEIEKSDSSEIETEAARLVKEKPGLSTGAYMGLIMAKFKGKVSGAEVSRVLQKLVK